MEAVKTEIGIDIGYAAKLLRDGEVVGVPTETVYGLAANAFSADAVLKIFEAKNRPFFDPLIVHCKDFYDAQKYVKTIPQWAKQLSDAFSPGPITFLLPKNDTIPDIVTSGLERVGIRVPSHPMLHELLSLLDFPLAAPSANPFGYISPTSAEHVHDQLQGKIHYILDGGQASVGVESTIVGEEEGNINIYRLGGISVEQIEAIVGRVELRVSSSMPSAPGSLDSHYAPKTRLRIKTPDTSRAKEGRIGILMFSNYSDEIPEKDQRILSPTKDLREAAKTLFACMRELDGEGYEVIYAELVPDEGLGKAINDRIQRASHQ